ncbi:MAG: S-methyl-5'-thioadenosine phosphorylase [Verrucomicrobia bacterium]|nr:S-methyl-5'-thioadenosine phosphorylase [Verrucomicrobiota bacterium]
MAKIGIIGGSGLDNPDLLKEVEELTLDTPYGATSSVLKQGIIAGREVVLLARHGIGHTIPPSQVNFRANIWAFKELGCTHILVTTAVGSLQEAIKPGDFVILDQFIDFSRHRINTFYDKFVPGSPIHVSTAEPFSAELRDCFLAAAKELSFAYHPTGTVISIEGPRFSTKAESHMFRAWGADVINMTIATEAALAKEAEIPYAAVAMSTDYDCWKEDEEPVEWEQVLKVFMDNAHRVTELLVSAVSKV